MRKPVTTEPREWTFDDLLTASEYAHSRSAPPEGGGVYRLWIGTYFYIGRASSFKERLGQHRTDLVSLKSTKRILRAHQVQNYPAVSMECLVQTRDQEEAMREEARLIMESHELPFCMNTRLETSGTAWEGLESPNAFSIDVECYSMVKGSAQLGSLCNYDGPTRFVSVMGYEYGSGAEKLLRSATWLPLIYAEPSHGSIVPERIFRGSPWAAYFERVVERIIPALKAFASGLQFCESASEARAWSGWFNQNIDMTKPDDPCFDDFSVRPAAMR